MLTFLGLASIAVLLALILFRLTSVLVALTIVPIAAGLAGGFAPDIGEFAMDGMRNVAPTAALLAFAVLYFGQMHDAGLFEPIIRRVLALVGHDPLKVVLGTAAVATIAHLDGAGASTFMVTVPAMLPLYARLGMDPLALTCTTALAAGTMNILPWGGPASRVATVLQLSVTEVFAPLVVATAAGMVSVFVFAAVIGYGERRRLSTRSPSEPDADAPAGHVTTPHRPVNGAWWFNATLTIATLVTLVVELVPLPVIFLVASAAALLFNFPAPRVQQERLIAHASSAMVMVTTVLAAGLFSGIMTKTGMLTAMARDVVGALPSFAVEHLAVGVAVASMPLSLAFDPDSFYFGVLPVLSAAAETAGGSGLEVARAALLGQMTTGFPVSPLTPATFLLVGIAQVDLADHQRRTIPYAFAVTLVMTLAALATGAIRW